MQEYIDDVETASRFGIAEDRAVTFHNDPMGQTINYAEVSAAVCRVHENAKLDRSWKRRIEEDYRSRESRR